MIFFIITLFLVVLCCSFFEYKDDIKVFLFFVFWCLFVGLAGFREVGSDKDSLTYLAVFNNDYSNILVEKSFHVISLFVRFCFGPDFLFVLFIYAFIGVSAKFLAIRQLTDLWFLSCMIYLANFFILQEMTQIRIGVATGMLLLSIKPLFDRQLLSFGLCVGVAIFFHYSACLLLPFWFLNVKNINRYVYGGLIILAYCFYYTGLTITEILSYVPIDYIQEKVKLNYEAVIINNEPAVKPFAVYQSLRLLIIALLFWKLERIVEYNKYVPLLLKLYVIGVVSYLLFADIPAFTVRISEFFQIVEIILIPLLVYAFKDKRIGIWLPIGIGVIFITLNLFYSGLIS